MYADGGFFNTMSLLTPPPSCRPELMEATAAWVRGQRFADVLQLQKDVFEGSLVRSFRRTEELMGQVGVRSSSLGGS